MFGFCTDVSLSFDKPFVKVVADDHEVESIDEERDKNNLCVAALDDSEEELSDELEDVGQDEDAQVELFGHIV